MRPIVNIHVEDTAQVECDCGTSLGDPDGYVITRLYALGDRGNGLVLFSSWEWLAKLHAVIGARLAAHGRLAQPIDGSADRVDIYPIPAEACTDCGEFPGLSVIDQEVS